MLFCLPFLEQCFLLLFCFFFLYRSFRTQYITAAYCHLVDSPISTFTVCVCAVVCTPSQQKNWAACGLCAWTSATPPDAVNSVMRTVCRTWMPEVYFGLKWVRQTAAIKLKFNERLACFQDDLFEKWKYSEFIAFTDVNITIKCKVSHRSSLCDLCH